ncbi:MAG: hypothetical protein JO054_02205, partial [Actinobacteria bacterium]|nr:hypothetical protein [Actinomycetota bacterium]
MPTDPLHELRRLSSPARPNPRFAISLWRRIEEELGMTTTTDTDLSVDRPAAGVQLGIIHIRVDDADRAAAFFGGLLDWETSRHDDGSWVAHYVTNTSMLHVLRADPQAPPVRLFFPFDNVRAAVTELESLGGGVDDSELAADGGGWAFAHDDQGLPLGLWRRYGDYAREGATPAARPLGEVGYLTLNVPDAERAMAFYGAMFGWRFQAPSGEYHHVDGSLPALGVLGGHNAPHVAWYIR